MIVGAVLFILGTVIVPVLFILPLIFGKSDEVQFMVPGTFEAKAEKPGRYYLWNDFQTIYDGKSYNRSEGLPDGMVIKILNSDGTQLHLVSDPSISTSNGSSAAKSIGYVEIENPGKIKIEVTGGDERVLSFAPSKVFKIVGLIVGAFAASALISISGLAIGIWGIIKLVRSNK